MDAVIFDFDGVLADTEPVHERAIRELFRPFGLAFDHAFFVEHCIGTSDTVAFGRIAEHNGRSLDDAGLPDLAELRARKQELFLGLVGAGQVEPCPGAVELVRQAAARVPVGVCTGSVAGQVVPVLERFGLMGLFGAVVSVDRLARPKPDPEGYRTAAAELGVDAARCTVIEDSPTGIAAGKAAGARVFAVGHSYPAARLGAADRVFAGLAAIGLDELVAGGPPSSGVA